MYKIGYSIKYGSVLTKCRPSPWACRTPPCAKAMPTLAHFWYFDSNKYKCMYKDCHTDCFVHYAGVRVCVCVLVVWHYQNRVAIRHAGLAPVMLQVSPHFNITNLLFAKWFGQRQRLTSFLWNKSSDNEEKYILKKVCQSLLDRKSASV